jgi:histidinol phosphatase-like enzyme
MTEHMGPDERALTGFTVPQRDRLLWIAIDLDGTIAEPIWSAGNPTSAIGQPIRHNVVKLREAVRAGYKVVIHTARPWSDFEAIEAWLNLHNIPFRQIQCGKILAARYVDDRGCHESESSWLPR